MDWYANPWLIESTAYHFRSSRLDKFWDDGGAVTPDVAAHSLVKWIDGFDINHTGEYVLTTDRTIDCNVKDWKQRLMEKYADPCTFRYWAPRGPGDIGTAEPVLGPKDKLSTPFQIPVRKSQEEHSLFLFSTFVNHWDWTCLLGPNRVRLFWSVWKCSLLLPHLDYLIPADPSS